MTEDMLWSQKYRPRRVEDCVLPVSLKKVFQKFVSDGFVPNLLLSGGPGVGKTTVARAMLDELECDSIIFNGSLNVDKDTLRNEIRNYASSVSMSGGRKYVILDEADYLNPNHVQPALRNFMEEFSKNCGFILTCNYKNKILPPLHSRCSVIEFQIPADEKQELAAQFYKRVKSILEGEGVEYDRAVLAAVIRKFFPDWRRVLNELQRYAGTGKIDSGILASITDVNISELVGHLRKQDFGQMRKWIAEQGSTIDTTVLLRRLYDESAQFLQPQSVPQFVVILAEYAYKAAFVADQEINLVACMTQCMVDCQFK